MIKKIFGKLLHRKHLNWNLAFAPTRFGLWLRQRWIALRPSWATRLARRGVVSNATDSRSVCIRLLPFGTIIQHFIQVLIDDSLNIAGDCVPRFATHSLRQLMNLGESAYSDLQHRSDAYKFDVFLKYFKKVGVVHPHLQKNETKSELLPIWQLDSRDGTDANLCNILEMP
jgi:hypothetical protein